MPLFIQSQSSLESHLLALGVPFPWFISSPLSNPSINPVYNTLQCYSDNLSLQLIQCCITLKKEKVRLILIHILPVAGAVFAHTVERSDYVYAQSVSGSLTFEVFHYGNRYFKSLKEEHKEKNVSILKGKKIVQEYRFL